MTQEEKQGEQKPTNKIEPKFKAGDWVRAISSGNIFKILSVNDGLYRVLCYDGIEANYPIEVQRDLENWTIQNAKEEFIEGAQWQKAQLWHDAQGDVLPEIDREVIVLVRSSYGSYRVGFGHRPNPNGWIGKRCPTGKEEHIMPALYDKGGWNHPNVLYWLDVKLPKGIE